jgi:hypothetical protein
MTRPAKRKQQTFELKAGPMPALQPAAPRQPADPNEPDGAPAGVPADEAGLDCRSQKALILRLVETVKAL